MAVTQYAPCNLVLIHRADDLMGQEHTTDFFLHTPTNPVNAGRFYEAVKSLWNDTFMVERVEPTTKKEKTKEPLGRALLTIFARRLNNGNYKSFAHFCEKARTRFLPKIRDELRDEVATRWNALLAPLEDLDGWATLGGLEQDGYVQKGMPFADNVNFIWLTCTAVIANPDIFKPRLKRSRADDEAHFRAKLEEIEANHAAKRPRKE
jgi:hypothetical protein